MKHAHRPLPSNGGTSPHHDCAHKHDHAHVTLGHDSEHRPDEKRRLRISIAITAAAMVIEAAGGYMTGSLALISDAGHMLTHAAALLVSLIAMALASRPTRPERSFGFYRVEVLAALFNAVTLAVITVLIAREAYFRLVHPQPILAWEMLGVAVFGLAVNLLTAWILHGAGQDDLNFRSAFLHMLGDTVSSVAIIFGAVLIRFTGRLWIDPVLSVLICLLIIWWSWGLVRDSVRILMESAPSGLRVAEVRDAIRSQYGLVHEVDDVHLWTITSSMNAMTAYVELTRDLTLAEQSDLAHDLRHFVADRFGICHAVFQFVPIEKS